MGDAASWVGIIIAMGSLVVAIIAMRKSLDAQREANAARRRIVEIEERREHERRLDSRQARLLPELRRTETGGHRLYLVNHGMAEARNVRVTLDGVPVAEHRAGKRQEKMPSLVGPNNEVSCLLLLSFDCKPPFQVDVRWDDDSGADRNYRTVLTF